MTAALGQESQPIAISEVQRPETGYLSHGFYVADTIPPLLYCSFDFHGLVVLEPEVVCVPIAVLLNLVHDGRDVIVLTQPVKPGCLFAVNTADGGILAVWVGFQHISLVRQGPLQLVVINAGFQGVVDCLPHQVVSGGLVILLCEVQRSGRVTLGILDD